jgi:hypothetical protein
MLYNLAPMGYAETLKFGPSFPDIFSFAKKKGGGKEKKSKAQNWNKTHKGTSRWGETYGSGSGGIIRRKPGKS